MKLEWIDCFVKIVETGSMNKAAEKLYVSQPAATKMMQALERELETQLLQRKKTGVTLTEQGEVFLPYAKNILREYRNYGEERRRLKTGQKSSVKEIELVVSSILMQTYYKMIESIMEEVFPNLEVSFIEADIDAAFPLISEDKQMLGFVNFGDEEMSNFSDDVKIEAVYQSPIICCMNKESGYDDYQTITKERLQPGAMISIGFSKKAYGMPYSKHNLSTVNLDLVREMIMRNKNTCALLPQCIAEKLFQSEEVCFMKYSPQPTVTFGLIYNGQALKEKIYDKSFLKRMKRTLQTVLKN